MANNNTPAHDFAPAWLKIPNYDSCRPTGADGERGGHTSRKDDHQGCARRSRETDVIIPRQQYFTDTRRDRDSFSGERKPYFPSRHHSIDFDDSQGPGNCARLFSCSNHNNSLSNSQPSLLRRPHSRHDFRDVPSYTKIGINQTLYEKTKGKESIVNICNNSDVRGMDWTSNTFNQEFPSLQGDDASDFTFQPPLVNGGAWEKPRNAKVHGSQIGKKIQLIKRGSKQDNGVEIQNKISSGSNSTSGGNSLSPKLNPCSIIVPASKNIVANTGNSSMFRTLVPSKELSTNGVHFTKSSQPSASTSAPLTKSKTSHSVLSNMEILVKNPKAPGNKSDFLKALRTETGNKVEDGMKDDRKDRDVLSVEKFEKLEVTKNNKTSDQGEQVNGLNIKDLSLHESNDNNEQILSRSLEAEQRLLREMGWKEEGSDDDAYAPLTEGELREFRQKIAEKKNGIQKNFSCTLSPRRMPVPYLSVVPRVESWSSISETDSDSD